MPPPPAAPPHDGARFDCSERPVAPTCHNADVDRSCADAHRAFAPLWQRWTLACEPVRPADPIAGERVEVLIPNAPATTGACLAGSRTRRTVVEGDVTVIRIGDVTRGDCRGIDGLQMIELGVLAPGRYRIESPGHETSFVVRPAGSDPGDLPLDQHVALEVAKSHDPGHCFGMPPGADPRFHQPPFMTMRVANQMKATYPNTSVEELEARYWRSTAIGIERTDENSWTYAYTDGGCCIIREVQGTVIKSADGTFEVGPDRVVSSRNEPC